MFLLCAGLPDAGWGRELFNTEGRIEEHWLAGLRRSRQPEEAHTGLSMRALHGRDEGRGGKVKGGAQEGPRRSSLRAGEEEN